MLHTRFGQLAKIVLSLAIGAALAVFLVACSSSDSPDDTATAAAGTAQADIEAARSVLSTVAPDAKLLVVQTAESTTPTQSPVWAYLFGSPSTDTTYIVYTMEGQVMSASEYGSGGLTAEEWVEVPSDPSWSIDSNQAYDKALAVSGADGDPVGYFMGMQTFVPAAATEEEGGRAYVWYVFFDPGESGATTSTIEVDAMTGDATVVSD